MCIYTELLARAHWLLALSPPLPGCGHTAGLLWQGFTHPGTGGEGRIEEPKGLFPCFYNVPSSQSCCQTWKGLGAAEATPAHPCCPSLEALSGWDELVPPMGLELPLPTPPALLCRLALGHRNSQHQLVWKYITNFFQEKDERTEEKLLFSKFITQQNLGEFLWKKKMHFHSSRDSFCNISKAGCKHQQCRTSQWQKVLNGPNRWVSIDSSGNSTVLHQPGDAGISSQVSRGLLWLLGLCVWVSLVLSAAVCSVMGGVCDLFCFHLV